jgi:hypothetical protein
MRIAILDPCQHATGFTLILPEADYYSFESSTFCNFLQRSPKDFYDIYNFYYKTEIGNINTLNYDTIIFIFPIIDSTKESHRQYGSDKVKQLFDYIIRQNKFNKVIVVDNHDSAYDPSIYFESNLVTHFFKRNYRKSIKYADNVHPFPFLIFGLPTCSLWFMIKQREAFKSVEKNMSGVFWAGAIYKESHWMYEVDRESIYNDSKHILDTYSGLQYQKFIDTMSRYKMALDMNGCGHPNKRTFEILTTRTLLLHQKNDVVYPFEGGNPFSEHTCFENGKELCEKVKVLNENNHLYNDILIKQNQTFETYFNKEWIRNYIMKIIL